jgi:hypothetical protein
MAPDFTAAQGLRLLRQPGLRRYVMPVLISTCFAGALMA